MVLISITSGDEDKRKARKMALLGLQPPPAFLECPGEPKVAFDAWKKLFDNYLQWEGLFGREEKSTSDPLLRNRGTETLQHLTPCRRYI